MPQLELRRSARDNCHDAVMAALDTVMDPELDESVAAMGFVESLAFSGEDVEVTFRLPTFWCSANFAFLMAADMRCAVERLGCVRTARVRLVDHFAARRINHGVAAGLGFAETFSDEAASGLADIRRTFRERAFLGRQEKLLRPLVARSDIASALALTMGGLHALAHDGEDALQALALRYLTMRRHEAAGDDAAAGAFIMPGGQPVRPGDYATHLRRLRSLTGAAEANAEMCRIYLQARIDHPAPGCEPVDRTEED